MARTIIEDYYKAVPNHFDLAYDVPLRARDIQRQGNALVAERDDKPIVIALREIAERGAAPNASDIGAAAFSSVMAESAPAIAPEIAPEIMAAAAPDLAPEAAPNIAPAIVPEIAPDTPADKAPPQ